MATVVGGGAAGLATAVTLARGGCEVVVHERRARVGRPRPDVNVLRGYGPGGDIGGFLGAIGVRSPMVRVHRAVRCSPSGVRREVVSRRRPLFFVVPRGRAGSVETALAEAALDAGARIVHGRPPSGVRADVIATGPRHRDIVAEGAVFDGAAETDAVHVLYSRRFAPGGYVYAAPHPEPGRASVLATCFGAPDGSDVRRRFERALRHWAPLKRMLAGARRRWELSGHGTCRPPATAVRGGSLLAGEAAGFQDPARGFGLRLALLSGHLAARAILEGSDYDRLWREAFGGEMEEGLRERERFERMGDAALEAYVRAMPEGTDGEGYEAYRRAKERTSTKGDVA